MTPFDPRLQIMTLLLCSILIFFTSLYGGVLLIIVLLGYLLLQGQMAITLKLAVAAAIVLILFLLPLYCTSLSALEALNTPLMIIIKIFPMVIAAASLSQVPMGKLMAALHRLRVPGSLLLILTVILRYLPIMMEETKIINENAAIRGLSWRQPANWRHPARLFEYMIVPLLMRTIRLSDELAAAGATRGIDAPGKKTSFYPIKFRPWDLFNLLALAAMFACLLV
ncbi:hypothetical protein TUM12370_33590 [Salmonella enterica subsp. enterica serovar Choleraesuis]|nr:hypothetical protein TUM12370_33590 [Salmonella enterica subsp. enterica serovar Choleraesuis]